MTSFFSFYTCILCFSSVAKVIRDDLLEGWKFSEATRGKQQSHHHSEQQECYSREYGSGYPSDPICKNWMEQLHDPVFGYCDFMRFSWGPAKNKVQELGVPVTFKADLDEDEENDFSSKKGMSAFLKNGGSKRKRPVYFERRNLQVATKLLKMH